MCILVPICLVVVSYIENHVDCVVVAHVDLALFIQLCGPVPLVHVEHESDTCLEIIFAHIVFSSCFKIRFQHERNVVNISL